MYVEYYAATVGVSVTVFLALAIDHDPPAHLRDQILRNLAGLLSFLGVVIALPGLLPRKDVDPFCGRTDWYDSSLAVSIVGGIAILALVVMLASWLLRDEPSPPVNQSAYRPVVGYVTVGILGVLTLGIAVALFITQTGERSCFI